MHTCTVAISKRTSLQSSSRQHASLQQPALQTAPWRTPSRHGITQGKMSSRHNHRKRRHRHHFCMACPSGTSGGLCDALGQSSVRQLRHIPCNTLAICFSRPPHARHGGNRIRPMPSTGHISKTRTSQCRPRGNYASSLATQPTMSPVHFALVPRAPVICHSRMSGWSSENHPSPPLPTMAPCGPSNNTWMRPSESTKASAFFVRDALPRDVLMAETSFQLSRNCIDQSTDN